MNFETYIRQYFNDINIDNLHVTKNATYLKSDKYITFPKNNNKPAYTNLEFDKPKLLYTLFNNYCKLGKDLYNCTIINKLESNKNGKIGNLIIGSIANINDDVNCINDNVVGIIITWINSGNYISGEELNTSDNIFAIKDLYSFVDICILLYLISEATNNYYHSRYNDNCIQFKHFIKITDADNNDNNINTYLYALTELLNINIPITYKNINTSTKISFENNVLTLNRNFNNIHSFLLELLKYYLSYLSICDKNDLFRVCLSCKSPIPIGNSKRCASCKTNHNSYRRNKNRKIELILNKLNNEINIKKVPKEYLELVKKYNEKHKYTDLHDIQQLYNNVTKTQ